jgi:hypothetical protein
MAGEIQQERELREQWQKAHDHVHDLERTALNHAATDMDRRLADHNGLLAQMAKDRSDFVDRKEHDLLADRIKDLEIARGEQTGKSAAYASIAGFIGVVAAIIGHYWK